MQLHMSWDYLPLFSELIVIQSVSFVTKETSAECIGGDNVPIKK